MTTGEAVWCHDCGTHEKCETQQQTEAELEQARTTIRAWTDHGMVAVPRSDLNAVVDRLRAMMGDSE